MVKIVVRVKPPQIRLVPPYRLVDSFSVSVKQDKISILNTVFNDIERWTKIERNYAS